MNAVLEELSQKLATLVAPLLQEKGLELIELNCLRQGRGFLFQVFVDKPQGGISLEECTWVNRRLSDVLDQNQITQEDYWLEVSSPGLDRPLKTAQDFIRVRGRIIHVYLKQPLAGKFEYQGTLKEVRDQEITIDTNNNPDFVIPLSDINKGLQVI